MNQPIMFPWDETSEESVFPDACVHFRIAALDLGYSNTKGDPDKVAKLMVKARFDALAPAPVAGMSHFEYYVLGTDENPQQPMPGSMGSRQFKKLLTRAQVPKNNDMAALCQMATGAEFMASMVQYKEEDGAYKGALRNRIADYHRVGEREAALAPAKGGLPAAPGMSTAPPPPPPVTAPAPTPASMTPPPVATSVPPPPTTTGPPPPPAPPQELNTGAPSPPPTTGGQLITCQHCQAQVPVAEFGDHVQAHLEGRS